MSRPTPDITLTPFQKQVALGTLLGDSSLSKPAAGKNYHLSCYHALAQRDWLTIKHAWLAPASRPIQWCAYTDKRDGKARKGGRFHSVSIPCFTELAGLLYDGSRKTLRPEALARLAHPVALACLIGDDGSWDNAGISIASKGFTPAENVLLAASLSAAFGLSVSPQLYGKYPLVRITAASAERARALCWEFIPESLRYKFGPPDYHTRLVGKAVIRCASCAADFTAYASSGQRYCSRRCAAADKPKGYAVRSKKAACAGCGREFTPYNRHCTRCPECR